MPAPLPCADPAVRAVRMALAMQQQLRAHLNRWRQQQYAFALGVGIAQGDAILGLLDVAGRLDYAAIGPVTQRAARLCDAAHGGHVLVCPRVGPAVEGLVHTAPAAALSQQGHACPITAVQVLGWGTPEDASS